MKFIKNQRGMSVMWIALLLSLLGIYAAVGNSLIAERSEAIGGVQQSEQALYLAESGLKVTLATLESNWGAWDDANAFPQQNFAGGQFDASVGSEGLTLTGYSYYPLEEAPNYGSNYYDTDDIPDEVSTNVSSGTNFSEQVGNSDQVYKIVSKLDVDSATSGGLMLAKSKKISAGNSVGSSGSGGSTSSGHLAGTYPDPNHSHKILLCHNAHTISVSVNALNGHQNHAQDTDGPCATVADPNKVDVIVQGNKGGSSRFIKATISKYASMLHNAIYTTGMIYIQGSTPIMNATGPIKTYYPTLSSSSTPTLPSPGFVPSTVAGYTTQYAQTFPGLNVAEAKELARGNNENGQMLRSDGNYFQGSAGLLTSLNGVIFIDTTLDGNPASVTLSNLSTLSTEPAMLIVRGNLFLSNVNFNGLIVALEGSSVMLDHSTINGAVLANQMVNLTGGSAVSYNSYNVFSDNLELALMDIVAPTVVAWKEYFAQ